MAIHANGIPSALLEAPGLVDVVLPLSGVTRMFDGAGRCVGCQ